MKDVLSDAVSQFLFLPPFTVIEPVLVAWLGAEHTTN